MDPYWHWFVVDCCGRSKYRYVEPCPYDLCQPQSLGYVEIMLTIFKGKSSVLQAVTEVPFDTGDGMCTRFATEIVLERTAPNERAETKARIIPDVNDSSDRKKSLKLGVPSHLINSLLSTRRSWKISLNRYGSHSIARSYKKAYLCSSS